jgi:hypothetical protein
MLRSNQLSSPSKQRRSISTRAAGIAAALDVRLGIRVVLDGDAGRGVTIDLESARVILENRRSAGGSHPNVHRN